MFKQFSETMYLVNAQSITQPEAVNLIYAWLTAKAKIFAPPFDRRLALKFTTDPLWWDVNSRIDWLINNQAHYLYGVQQIDEVERFVANGSKASIRIRVTELAALYVNGCLDRSQNRFTTHLFRYDLKQVNGTWKIYDSQKL